MAGLGVGVFEDCALSTVRRGEILDRTFGIAKCDGGEIFDESGDRIELLGLDDRHCEGEQEKGNGENQDYRG